MSGRAPEAIYGLWYAIKKAIPQAELGGILGDAAHFAHGGYHVPRQSCPPGDYSTQLAKDKLGKPDCASALDVSLPPDLMKLCTGRLVHAARANDPRLKTVREFCGTLNGTETFPWQIVPTNGSEGLGTWDDSHLWHIHVSILRQYADDEARLLPIAEVFAGVPLKYPPANPKWSDTVTKDEIQKMIDDSLVSSQRAVLKGGDHGDWTAEAYPALVKDEGHGVLDRIDALEKAAKP